MSEEIAEQIDHYEELIAKYTTQEVRNDFGQLTPDQHIQWISSAQKDKFYNEDSMEAKCRYIGKVTLAHLYELKNDED